MIQSNQLTIGQRSMYAKLDQPHAFVLRSALHFLIASLERNTE